MSIVHVGPEIDQLHHRIDELETQNAGLMLDLAAAHKEIDEAAETIGNLLAEAGWNGKGL